jgi:hypothetical protein
LNTTLQRATYPCKFTVFGYSTLTATSS